MDHSDVQAWLDRYVDTWRTYDRKAIEGLFTEDAEYRYHPYDEPIVGAEAIAESWLKEQDEPGSWEASYRAHLVEGTRAIATGTTTYGDGRTYWNLWELEFATDGRCSRFGEWFMRHP